MRLPKSELETNEVPQDVGTVSLLKLLALFLKIGSLGFGGGMATIALMEQDFVKKRQLLSVREFVHGVGLGHLLGGVAVNVAAFVGYRLFGLTGALLSTTAFLAPSFLVILLLSKLYFRFGTIPALQGTMAGVSPVVIALILSAAWSVGRQVSVLLAYNCDCCSSFHSVGRQNKCRFGACCGRSCRLSAAGSSCRDSVRTHT